MGIKDPRVDQYIESAAEFAKPILQHIRRVVHAADPKVAETLKWSIPHFKHEGILCNMAAFKNHCSFGFWKGGMVVGKKRNEQSGMGNFGKLTKVSDLPSEAQLAAFLKKAIHLNEEGI